MSYTSLVFIAFVFAGVLIYFLLPRRLQPYWLLLLSAVFYCSSDIRYALFLLTSIVMTYLAGRILTALAGSRARKLVLLAVGVVNLGLLILVKWGQYFFDAITGLLGKGLFSGLPLLVPLGISFYTLQAISYCADVYRGKYPAEKNLMKYALYMSFFPTVVQGPISRFDQLGDRLWEGHRFDYTRIKLGMQLALWGFFKKLVLADRAALLVNEVFNHHTQYAGAELALAALLYSLQLYADFSGCVDICRGISQMFGIELIHNFERPYFSGSIKEFWRRWHISLSSWLRDYVYISLGGNRKGTVRKYLNLIAVFLVSGFWHGVGMHYIVWGLLHGAYQVVGDLTRKPKEALCLALKINQKSRPYRWMQKTITFGLVTFAWIFFRSNGLKAGVEFVRRMVGSFDLSVLLDGGLFKLGLDAPDFVILLCSVAILFLVSLLQRKYRLRERIEHLPIWIRWPMDYLGIFAVLIFGIYGPGYNASGFIYMQF